jgi:hypothetical protein
LEGNIGWLIIESLVKARRLAYLEYEASGIILKFEWNVGAGEVEGKEDVEVKEKFLGTRSFG